jgi:hypothetical protein
MSNRINEDINYMKYLMGYEKGRVISEQRRVATKNILLIEQVLPTDPEEIKAFQDYMDTIGPWVYNETDGKYYKLNKGGGYGTFGKNTQAAWRAYGTQYIQYSEGGTDVQIDPKTGKLVVAQTGTGTNNYVEPVVSITKSVNKGVTSWIVEGFAYFPAGQTKSTVSEYVMKAIKEKIFSDPLLKSPTAGTYVKLISGSLRGGASNSDGAPAEISFPSDDYKKFTTLTPTITTKNKTAYNSNKKYAQNRASNFWNYLVSNLPSNSNGGSVQVSHKATIKTEGYIVDTGGVTDSNSARNWETNPIPGQQVYFKFAIQLLPGKEPNKSESTACLWKSLVSFTYTSGDHSCDMATFDIYANSILVGTIDLGNGQLLVNDKANFKYKNASIDGTELTATEADTVGGPVSGTLKITGKDLAQEIVDKSLTGEVVITAVGKDETFYKGRKFNCLSGCSTHSDIPLIKATNSKGNIVFDARPTSTTKMPRCGASKGQYTSKCETWVLAKFNPCGTSVTDGTLSKEITKGK